MSNGFEEISASFDPYVRDLANHTKALITEVCPDVVEVPWVKQKVVGYGVGPRKMSEHFCYIAFHKDHVNLGFNQGAELPDPHEQLEGPGKMLRHLKISAAQDLRNPAIRDLLEAARVHRLETRPAQ